MIIETNKNAYFNTGVCDLLYIQETAFPTVEWFGLEQAKELEKFLSHIFNPLHTELIAKHIGMNLHMIRVFTESVLKQPSAPDFLKLLRLPLQLPQWTVEFAIFQNKVQSLYSHPYLEHLLRTNEIDFAVTPN